MMLITVFSVSVLSLDFFMAGHYDPTGTMTSCYAYDLSECDRKVNVSFYDTNGSLLKKVVIHTKKGEERSFSIGIGGYDITKFESNQGLWESCKMVWTSGAEGFRETNLHVEYKFITGLSKDELNITVTMRKWDPISVEVRHYIEQNPNKSSYTLYTTNQNKTIDYYDYFSTNKINIAGYTLRSDYESSISGNFCANALIGKSKNCTLKCFSCKYVKTEYSSDASNRSSYDESKHGRLDYFTDRKFWIEYYYDLNEYTITYNANGGSGAPSSQTKHYGYDLVLSDTVPTRTGYKFKGWGTYSSDTSANYRPGENLTTNTNLTLYAVWESEYTVSYNANGGSGAPSPQTKSHNVSLTLSSVIPKRTGYAFLGWSTNSSDTTAKYQPGGKYFSNASITLYAVWEKQSYIISYNANGGTGAPLLHIKFHDTDITLSSVKPQRGINYTFLGWSTSSTATSATYQPGDTFSLNADTVLYAVWEEKTYEFSISNLTVDNETPTQNSEISIKVRADSWDKYNVQEDVPIHLYIDGKLISTKVVDFAVYGYVNLTFNVKLDSTIGNRTIEVRVNWYKRNEEYNVSNNSVSKSIYVKADTYSFNMQGVQPNAAYKAGTTVVSSFMIANNTERDVLPSTGADAHFSAYYYNGSQKVVINSQTWSNAVIPAGKTNLVYFKWTVPENLAGKTVYCECGINADGRLPEEYSADNTSSYTVLIADKNSSQTTNPGYMYVKPSSFSPINPPTTTTGGVSWTVWEYENGNFVLKKYGIQLNNTSPEITPSENCDTAKYIDGEWSMKSGYGVSLNFKPQIGTLNGCYTPNSSAYTSVQSACAAFPEYMYSRSSGEYRTLVYLNGSYCFVENPDADGYERIHYIPVWFDDGDYVVSLTLSDIWTPAGMLTVVRNSSSISIEGSIYDDWYGG